MIGPAGTNFSSGIEQIRLVRLQQAAYRQAIVRAGQHSVRQGGRSAVDIIAEQNRGAVMAMLEGEEAADERSLLVAGTADAGLGEISAMLTEARGLTAASADSGISADERAANQIQLDSILAGIDRIAQSTTFAGQDLLDGSAILKAGRQELTIASAASSKIGTLEVDGEQYALADVKTGGSLALNSGNGTISSDVIDAAITQVAQARQGIGNFVAHHLAPRLNAVAAARTQLAKGSAGLGDFDSAVMTLKGIRRDLLERAGKFMNGGKPEVRGSLVDLVA